MFQYITFREFFIRLIIVIILYLYIVFPIQSCFANEYNQIINQFNPEIRIGVTQHFSKDKKQSLKFSTSNPSDQLVLHYPNKPSIENLSEEPLETNYLKDFILKASIVNQAENKQKGFQELNELDAKPVKAYLIAGNYRTFETANFWKSELSKELPELEWEVVYPNPWQVRTITHEPVKFLKKLMFKGYSPSWIEVFSYNQNTLQWLSPITTSTNQSDGILYKFNRKALQVTSKQGLPIKMNGQLYPGTIEVIPDSFGTFSVINKVQLEDYLRGVVPYEVGPDASDAAIETQAILARTYTLANLHRFAPENYHLCATQHCQVYKGLNASNQRIDVAIKRTEGIVLKDNTQVAQIFYYSTDGGFSANYDDIWESSGSNNFSNLIGVSTCKNLPKSFDLSKEDDVREFLTRTDYKAWDCFDDVSRVFRWKKEIKIEDLTKILEEAKEKWKFNWPDFIEIKNVNIEKRSKTGRVLELLVTTDAGEFKVLKDEVRATLGGLRSSLFVIERGLKNDEVVLTFKGGGFGHGVGLSQFGARKLSDQGYSYKEILQLYFPKYQLGLHY